MPTTHEGVVAALWVARAKRGKEAEVNELLSRIVTPSRHDQGNIDYEAHEDAENPGTFVVYERWVSREALERHKESPWISTLIPPLLELIDGAIEDELHVMRPVRPVR